MHKIYALSDGTGRTAEQALQAALTQFRNCDAEIILKPEVRSVESIEEIVGEVALHNGFIVHTLVNETLRESILRICRIHNVEAIDLMGPLLLRLTHFLGEAPQGEPGLFYTNNKEYFKRIDSIKFAFNHDDGLRDDEYHLAEIILVGVSRTFKTPLSVFLAYKGWYVANYPVVLGTELPDSLSGIPYGRVFGLTTQAQELSLLRQARLDSLGGSNNDYASVESARKELAYAHRLFNHFQWPVIQVTNKPIEEIASEILMLRKKIIQGL